MAEKEDRTMPPRQSLLLALSAQYRLQTVVEQLTRRACGISKTSLDHQSSPENPAASPIVISDAPGQIRTSKNQTRPLVSSANFVNGLKGVAGFTCSGERPLFYFRFSETPNLIDDEIHDSFNESRTHIKFDEGHPKQITLLQMWGSPSLRVNTYRNVNLGGWNHTPDPKWLQEVSTSSEMLIELPWYSLGKVYFRFDLHGAESALREAGCLG